MGIVAGQNILASDFINQSEKNVTPANDAGRVPKLETTGKLHADFVPSIGWTLIISATPSGNMDVTGLSGYESLLIVFKDTTASPSSIRTLVVSSDNGSSFYTASGDYKSQGDTSQSNLFISNASSGAYSGFLRIDLFNVSGPYKPAFTSYSTQGMFVKRSEAMNAIRIGPSLSGGTIYVYGK